MDKEHKAVERLRLAAEMSETYYAKPLIITTSGGKDSDACLALARAAGIRYEVQHNHTTADAPKPSTMCAKLSAGWKTRASSVPSTCRPTKVSA